MTGRFAVVNLAAFIFIAISPPAYAGKKPRVPAGVDPSGVAIAILTTGIDYTRAEVAAWLARDGEGELIGRDVVDGDNRPYLAATDILRSNAEAQMIATLGSTMNVRFIPIRIDATRPKTISEAMSFVTQTQTKLVVAQASDFEPGTIGKFAPVLFLTVSQTPEPREMPSPENEIRFTATDPEFLARLLQGARDCFRETAPADGTSLKLRKLASVLAQGSINPRRTSTSTACDDLVEMQRWLIQ